MTSYQVKFWDIKKLSDTAKGRYRLRWTVAGREHHRSFPTKALATSFQSRLVTAARGGEPFDEASGLPVAMLRGQQRCSWYAHARGYARMKWPRASAKSRSSIADALATVTAALVRADRGRPEARVLRAALYGWAFNPHRDDTQPPREIADALTWIERASVSLSALNQARTVREALNAVASTVDGHPAAATTVRRKRAVLSNALGYAVELDLLPANPVGKVQWTAPEVADQVDRRVVAGPTQVRRLLAAVDQLGRADLVAFFGCLYFAAMRHAEAVHLRASDCVLPDAGWGRLELDGSAPRAGSAWTDHGASFDPRQLKHRARKQSRTVPIPPELVTLLRRHLEHHSAADDGRLFPARNGGYLSESVYGRIWQKARAKALTPAQAASPLAARPYDLRHGGVSLWLNAGVPATDVAERAGHPSSSRSTPNASTAKPTPTTSESTTRSRPMTATPPTRTERPGQPGVATRPSMGGQHPYRHDPGNGRGIRWNPYVRKSSASRRAG